LHDESPAFRQALLKSERLRILVLFFAIGMAFLLRFIRTLIAWNPENARDFFWLALSVTILVAIELFVLRAIGPMKMIRNQVEAALREAETRREVEHLQHDLDVARSIQQSLLPKSMPQIPGFDIAAWNKPADQTGGDYYDWQALPDGRILVAFADVAGHGIGPALLASVCRAYSRATFGQHLDFLKSMEQINTAISADVGEGRFVTFVAAILGPASSQVELLSAGHAPLFLYWLKHDRFDKMEAQGLPLGISPDFLSEPPQILPFASGDLLVLAPDGFFEWAMPVKSCSEARAWKIAYARTAINQRLRLFPLSIRMYCALRVEPSKRTTLRPS